MVISLIGMVSSIILTSVQPARAKARDATRTQQLRQIDLGVKLYESVHNSVPDLQESCAAGDIVSSSDINECIANSEADPGSPQGLAWIKFKKDLEPYIKNIPPDPCGNSCGVEGYTYVSPAAVYFSCTIEDCEPTDNDPNSSYQLYTSYETSTSNPVVPVDPDAPVITYLGQPVPSRIAWKAYSVYPIMQYGYNVDHGEWTVLQYTGQVGIIDIYNDLPSVPSGQHTFELVVINNQGSASQMKSIQFNKESTPFTPPIITIPPLLVP